MYKKLHEELNTRYIISTFASDVNKLLKSYDKWDFAQCKFGPASADVLSRYYATHDFINSENEELDWILKENCRRAKVQRNLKEFKELRVAFHGESDVLSYIESLDRSAKYRLPDGVPSSQAVALVTLIQMILPYVVVDAGIALGEIVSSVRQGLDWTLKKTGSYWLQDKLALRRVDVANGSVKLLSGASIAEDELIRLYPVLPYEFGIERTVEDPAYECVVANALEAFNQTSDYQKKKLLLYL